MKHKYRLKSAKKAILHGFSFGDFSGADRIEEHNNNILADVFKRIQFGLVDFAYINTGGAAGGNLYIISRDTVYSFRGSGAVRVTCFWRRGSGFTRTSWTSFPTCLKHFHIKHTAIWQIFGAIVFCRPAGFMWARIGAKIYRGWRDGFKML